MAVLHKSKKRMTRPYIIRMLSLLRGKGCRNTRNPSEIFLILKFCKMSIVDTYFRECPSFSKFYTEHDSRALATFRNGWSGKNE